MPRLIKFLFCLVLITAIFSGCATIEDVNTLHNRILALENRSKHLEKQKTELSKLLKAAEKSQEKKEQKLRGQSANIRSDLNVIRQEIRELTGKIEEMEFLLKTEVDKIGNNDTSREARLNRLDEIINLNKYRLIQLEEYLGLEPVEKAVIKNELVETKKPEGEKAESELYQEARADFDSGAFDSSRQKFMALLKKFPKSKTADNAVFWIGESYYREKWFEKAILEYQKVIENYPRGNKVPAALFKQGLSFQRLGDKSNARLIYSELIKKHKKTREADLARQQLKSLNK